MKLKRSTARKTKTGAPRLGTSTKALKPVPLMPRCSKRGGLVLRALVHRHCEEGDARPQSKGISQVVSACRLRDQRRRLQEGIFCRGLRPLAVCQWALKAKAGA